MHGEWSAGFIRQLLNVSMFWCRLETSKALGGDAIAKLSDLVKSEYQRECTVNKTQINSYTYRRSSTRVECATASGPCDAFSIPRALVMWGCFRGYGTVVAVVRRKRRPTRRHKGRVFALAALRVPHCRCLQPTGHEFEGV
jgi:capsule polysaccharide export protein KpsC/LpsZ